MYSGFAEAVSAVAQMSPEQQQQAASFSLFTGDGPAAAPSADAGAGAGDAAQDPHTASETHGHWAEEHHEEEPEDKAEEDARKAASLGASSLGAGLDLTAEQMAHAAEHGGKFLGSELEHGAGEMLGKAGNVFGLIGGAIEGAEGIGEMAHAKNLGEGIHGGLKTLAGGAEVVGGIAGLTGATAAAAGTALGSVLAGAGPVGAALGAGVAIGDALAPVVFSGPQEAKTADGQSHGSTGNGLVDTVFGVGKSSDEGEGQVTGIADIKASNNAIGRDVAALKEAQESGDEQAAAAAQEAAQAHIEAVKRQQEYIAKHPFKAALASIFG